MQSNQKLPCIKYTIVEVSHMLHFLFNPFEFYEHSRYTKTYSFLDIFYRYSLNIKHSFNNMLLGVFFMFSIIGYCLHF